MPAATLRDEYVAALLVPDARRARGIISGALAEGTDPRTIYLDVLAPALYEVGRRWERAEIGVATEHIASTTTESVMAELAGRLRTKSPPRGSAVVACVGEELHRLGSRIVADFLEADGWTVNYLGAMVPVDQIVASAEGAGLVALSVTMSVRAGDVARACAALKALEPAPFVAVGGQGVTGGPLAADLVSHDPRELIERARGLPVRFVPGHDPVPRADLYADEQQLVAEVLRLNDDLVQARREIARVVETLQRSLLPRELPRVAGVRLAARYVPGTTDEVGGDFYDALELPEGRLAVMIGDVAGKGVEAAARMGEVRSALRAYLLDEADPSVVLARGDRLVQGMVTALVGVFDPATGAWRHASAGHLPPLLIGRGYVPGGSGAPLSIYTPVAPAEARLVPGDRLLLFTDGLIERRDEPLDLSLARLEATAEETDLDGLLALAPSGAARDDVALLALEYAPG